MLYTALRFSQRPNPMQPNWALHFLAYAKRIWPSPGTTSQLQDKPFCKVWAISILTLPSAVLRANSSSVWKQQSPRSLMKNASPARMPPCTATKNRPVVRANLARCICEFHQHKKRTSNSPTTSLEVPFQTTTWLPSKKVFEMWWKMVWLLATPCTMCMCPSMTAKSTRWIQSLSLSKLPAVKLSN